MSWVATPCAETEDGPETATLMAERADSGEDGPFWGRRVLSTISLRALAGMQAMPLWRALMLRGRKGEG